MPFLFNQYSALLLIFFLHGLVYAALLLQKGIKNERASDRWLSLFLLLCALYIAPWMLGFGGWYDDFPNGRLILFYVPFHHTLLMGPSIFFYLRTLFEPGRKFKGRDWWHLLPGGLYLLWCGVVAFTDLVVVNDFYLMDGVVDPDFDSWYVIAGLVSLLYYLWRCILYYQHYKRFIQQQFSFADAVTFRWVRNFLIAFFVYCAGNLFFHLVQFAFVSLDYADTWWYYLIFALLTYYIAINGYANSVETRNSFQLHLNTADTSLSSIEEPAPLSLPDAETKNEILPELEGWKEKLLRFVRDEKGYADPELTLSGLAAALGTNATLMSRLINTGFGMNFNDFINSYRVEAVKQRLLRGDGEQLTIMSLAYDAGFNSKATFNRAFKKFTGSNPKDFGSEAGTKVSNDESHLMQNAAIQPPKI